MKKALLTAFALPFTLLPALAGNGPQDRDLAAVMKVVKRPAQQAPAPQSQGSRKEAETIKMRIAGGNGEVLSIRVPFALLEWIASLDEDATLNQVGGRSDVKLSDLIAELKNLGPSELIEIKSGDSVIRIALE